MPMDKDMSDMTSGVASPKWALYQNLLGGPFLPDYGESLRRVMHFLQNKQKHLH
jgi:hypothetical protein